MPVLAIQTVEDTVYETMRDQIIAGTLAPKAVLRLTVLAAELGVSTMPVRSALSRLQREGLVRQEPRRASIVAPLDLDDLVEIQTVRQGMEGIGARLGAGRLRASDLDAMERLLARTRRAVQRQDLNQFQAIITQLHDVVYRAVGRREVLDLIHQYERRAERYIRIALAENFGFRQALQQQEEWLAACRDRDGARAEAVIRAALEWTVGQVGHYMTIGDGRGLEGG